MNESTRRDKSMPGIAVLGVVALVAGPGAAFVEGDGDGVEPVRLVRARFDQ